MLCFCCISHVMVKVSCLHRIWLLGAKLGLQLGWFISQSSISSKWSLLSCTDTNMVENHTITWTVMFSRDGHSQTFQCGTVAISINCASMFQDIHQQHMQQIPQYSASRWCHLCHFKLPIPGWDRMFPLRDWSLTAGTELWIHVSSPVTTQCGYDMLKETETGDHPCNKVVCWCTKHPSGTQLTAEMQRSSSPSKL